MIIGNNNEPLPEVIVEPPDMEKVLIDLTKRAITSFFILFQGTIVAIIASGKAYCFKDQWPRLTMTQWISTEFAETIFLQKEKRN